MAAANELPSDYDAVVLGTGMTECIIAAALSRIGYNVLHLDRFNYYSADWASFHFQALLEWIHNKQDSTLEKLNIKEATSVLKANEKILPMTVEPHSVRNVKTHLFIRNEKIADSKYEDSLLKTEQLTVQETKNSDIKERGCGDCISEQTSEQVDSNEAQTISDLDCASNVEKEDHSNRCSDGNGQSGNVAENTCDQSKDTDKLSKEEQIRESNIKEWSFSEIKSLWRKFNLDLMPKVLYCRGAMVDLLISSDVAKYCEFKTVSKVVTCIKGNLEQVPCSRADVFSSKQVSMIEKRMMMKFLTFCIDFENAPNEFAGFEDKPFCDFLGSKKLSANVQHYIQHSIAMVTDTTSTLQGLKQCQKFLQSLGRYGNTAFLWPVYGSGELPQCFCRMCAVFGGVYCLQRTAVSAVIDEKNECIGVLDTEGQRLNTKWLIAEASYISPDLMKTPICNYTSRAILLTDRPLCPQSEDNITLLSYPVKGLTSPVTLFELPPSSHACPPDIYVVHLTCVCSSGAETDFEPLIKELFHKPDPDSAIESEEPTKPNILWSLMFEIIDTTNVERSDNAPHNMFVVGGPNHEFDFDYAITKAKEIFEVLCPGQEFLPKAPNPEDIIWDDGEGNKPSESGFEPDSNKETTDENKTNSNSQEEKALSNETSACEKLNNESTENETISNCDIEQSPPLNPGETDVISDEVK